MISPIFDYLGTAAFALSGATLGMQKKMDIFGVSMLALATAVGGGMIRDVLVGNTPPASLRDPIYILISLAAVFALAFLSRTLRRTPRRRQLSLLLFHLSDTFGLASFTVTGAVVGLAADSHSQFLLPIVLGMMTACGGGVIRDICALRIPIIFRHEVYASASLAGGIVFCLARPWLSLYQVGLLTFFVVLAVRLPAIYYKWELPRPTGRPAKRRSI